MYRAIVPRGHNARHRIESLARDQTEKSINTIIQIRDQADCPPGVRLKAALELIYMGWGKPKETHVVEDVQGRSLMKIVHEIVHVNETQEQIDNEDLVVDYKEIKHANGNGRVNGGQDG